MARIMNIPSVYNYNLHKPEILPVRKRPYIITNMITSQFIGLPESFSPSGHHTYDDFVNTHFRN